MPKIGMRLIKTALAVFLCFIIYRIRGEGIPFYSAIAAVLCMQREIEDSKEKGKNRMLATLIGGIAGMGILYLFKYYGIDATSWLCYLFVSASLIPLIYTTVLLKQPDCAYISCVVFLCICISHGNDADPFAFALNRMLDTWIGILVAIGVNAFHLPHRKHKHLWLEIPFGYLSENDSLSVYMQHYLRRFSKEGLHLLITSSKTPAQLNQCAFDSFLPSAFALLDGAIFYDRQNDRCQALCEMPYSLWSKLADTLSASEFSPFLYEISDQRLYIHHQEIMTEAERQFYEQCLSNHENHFVLSDQAICESYRHDCVMLELWTKKERIGALYQLLRVFIREITWIAYERDHEMMQIRIYSQQLVQNDCLKDVMGQSAQTDIQHLRYKHQPNEKQIVRDMKKLFYHHENKSDGSL